MGVVFHMSFNDDIIPTQRLQELASVSHRWWLFIKDLPSLWTYIDESEGEAAIMLHIRKSEQLPLHVRLNRISGVCMDRPPSNSVQPPEWLEQLRQQTMRWKTLKLHKDYGRDPHPENVEILNGTLPIQTLSVNIEHPLLHNGVMFFLTSLPMLRYVVLRQLRLLPVGENWAQLTGLDLYCCGMLSTTAINFFKHCTRLSVLKLDAVFDEHSANDDQAPVPEDDVGYVLHFPHLETLHVQNLQLPLTSVLALKTEAPRLKVMALDYNPIAGQPGESDEFINNVLERVVDISDEDRSAPLDIGVELVHWLDLKVCYGVIHWDGWKFGSGGRFLLFGGPTTRNFFKLRAQASPSKPRRTFWNLELVVGPDESQLVVDALRCVDTVGLTITSSSMTVFEEVIDALRGDDDLGGNLDRIDLFWKADHPNPEEIPPSHRLTHLVRDLADKRSDLVGDYLFQVTYHRCPFSLHKKRFVAFQELDKVEAGLWD